MQQDLSKRIIVRVFLANVPILVLGLVLVVYLSRQNFDSVNEINTKTQVIFEKDILEIEGDLIRMTEQNYDAAAQLEGYKRKIEVSSNVLEAHKKAQELHGAIALAAVPLARKLVSALSGQKELGGQEMLPVLRQGFGDLAEHIYYLNQGASTEQLKKSCGMSTDCVKYTRRALQTGTSDWFEDEVGDQDVLVSLVPLVSGGKKKGVFLFVFDMSGYYTQLDLAKRAELSLETTQIQEQRLLETHQQTRELETRRALQRQAIAQNALKNTEFINTAQNRLLLVLGLSMTALILSSILLFWWLGTRRISRLKNWFQEITRGNDRREDALAAGELPACAVSEGAHQVKGPPRRVQIDQADEIGELAQSINAMLDSLERTMVSKALLAEEMAERRIVEKQVWANQQRLNDILQAVKTGVVIVDAESQEIVDANPAALAMMATEKALVLGKTCQDFFRPARQRLGELVSAPPGEAPGLVMETTKGRKISLIKTETEALLGERRHSIYSFFDISDLAKAREDLERAKNAAETANRIKSEFLANVSHEIRTPLNGVIGMAEIALESGLNEHQSRIVRTISKEGDSLLRIINDVLDFSKIEAGKMELETIPFDLHALCDEVVQGVAYGAEQKGLEVHCYIDPRVPRLLLGDSMRLTQVLKNLCGNALKFTPDGEIVLQVALVEESGQQVRVSFSVKDTGIGIPKEKLPVIFDSFTQADGSTTRKFGGTGLGTAIARQLVELMGGQIAVESAQGQGSTFHFAIPLGKGEEPAPAGPDAEGGTPLLKGLKILAVDDSQTTLTILEEYLGSWGCILKKATHAREALALFRKAAAGVTPFDLIITDFDMPEISGLTLVQQVRQLEGTGQLVPVLVLSSSITKWNEAEWRAVGVDGYLKKPVLQPALRRAVEAALGIIPSLAAVEQRPSQATPPSTRLAGRILLVDDYATNQMVGLAHLTGAGMLVEVAGNGRQATEMFRQQAYDLVLMDIQMPEMDGYQATRLIRQWEKQSGRSHRVPILAMTAHAIKGYREQCLDAGMDDYLTKPLKKEKLLRAIDQWLRGPSQAAPKALGSRPDGEAESTPVNLDKLMQEFGDHVHVIEELLSAFSANLAGSFASLQHSLEQNQLEALRREAHALKGGALNVEAPGIARCASELEQAAERGDLTGARAAVLQLAADIYQFQIFYRVFAGTPAPDKTPTQPLSGDSA